MIAPLDPQPADTPKVGVPDPEHERAVNMLYARVIFLSAAAAATVAVLWTRAAGSDWPGALMRGEIAAVAVAMLGLLAHGPVGRALQRIPEPEPPAEPETPADPKAAPERPAARPN